MDFLTLAKYRYSVRKFDGRNIEPAKLNLILEAGRIAPTAANRQPQRIYVLETPESLLKVKECVQYDFHPPMMLVVGYDKQVSWKRKYDGNDTGSVDCAIVGTHMMLEAWELGIGTTWIAAFDPDRLKVILELPLDFVPVLMFAIGYPADDAKPGPQHFERNPLIEGINLFHK
jgi:nitroreductase